MTETFPPGDPQGIWGIADGLDDRAKILTSASDQLLALRKIPWYSAAGDAYRAHVTKRCQVMDDNAADIKKGASILRNFGKYLLDLQREYAELEQKRATLEKTLTAASTAPMSATTATAEPDPTAAASMALTIGKQADIQLRWQEAVGQATADIKALDLYPGDSPSPTFRWPWEEDTDPPIPSLPIDGVLAGDFDEDDIMQGSIGSCAILSTLMGYLRTNAGDEMLKNNIRWDSKKKGYWVTLYPDGEPKEYFVNKVFEDGSKAPDGKFLFFFDKTKPGIGALYEAAIYQAVGGYKEIDNGADPREMMSLITGDDPSVDYYGEEGDSSRVRAINRTRFAMEDGASAVATSTQTLNAARDDTMAIEADQMIDGKISKGEIELYAHHAYSIAKIDDDGGVWLENPHGPDNSADGGHWFKLSEKDFAKYFPWLQASGRP